MEANLFLQGQQKCGKINDILLLYVSITLTLLLTFRLKVFFLFFSLLVKILDFSYFHYQFKLVNDCFFLQTLRETKELVRNSLSDDFDTPKAIKQILSLINVYQNELKPYSQTSVSIF